MLRCRKKTRKILQDVLTLGGFIFFFVFCCVFQDLKNKPASLMLYPYPTTVKAFIVVDVFVQI